MRYKGCHRAHNAQVVMCALFTTRNSLKLQGRRKVVFTHSQSSCHIAKVVLPFRHDSRQIPIASDAPPCHASRGFLHWRLSDDGPGASRIVPDGRHPKPFTRTEVPKYLKTCKSTFRMHNIRRTARADSMLCCE